MKRFGAFFVFIYATICCIYGVTIRHTAEFSTDKLELNIQEFGDTTATVITWSDMSPVGNPGEYALPSTFVSFAVPCGASGLSIENVRLVKADNRHIDRPVSLIQPVDGNLEMIPVDLSVAGKAAMKNRSQVTYLQGKIFMI